MKEQKIDSFKESISDVKQFITKKYSFPSHCFFCRISNMPHYTSEVGVYIGLAALEHFSVLSILPLVFTVCLLFF